MERLFTRFAVLSLLLWPTVSLAGEAPEAPLPEGLRGFSGRVRGEVTAVQADGRGFVLRVSAVEQVWKNNRAEEPKAAEGRAFRVLAQWAKGEDGQWHPVENHVRFIRTIRAGEEIAIEVIQDEGERFHVLELTAEQRRRAGRGRAPAGGEAESDAAPSVPSGFAGFSGILEGRVLRVLEGGFGFLYRASTVSRTWKGNEAKEPASAVGAVLLVQPRWEKTDAGGWRPSARHLRFIRRLKAGQTLSIEVQNRGGPGVHILELSEDQRRAAEED